MVHLLFHNQCGGWGAGVIGQLIRDETVPQHTDTE